MSDKNGRMDEEKEIKFSEKRRDSDTHLLSLPIFKYCIIFKAELS